MPDYESDFLDENAGPDPWAEDAELVTYLINWLGSTCLLKGHQLRPGQTIQGPETWRQHMAHLLHQGRSHASIAARDDVLRAIKQTEPDLAEQLPEPKDYLDTPDIKIAESA